MLNERELLTGIQALLDERGEGEKLVEFDQDNFASQAELIAWFHENAQAVIGPHGGAMFNHRW